LNAIQALSQLSYGPLREFLNCQLHSQGKAKLQKKNNFSKEIFRLTNFMTSKETK